MSLADILIETKEVTTEKKKTAKVKKIILYNDHVNTFDFVIESLIELCGHDSIQAEQCTYLVHYAGRCEVKNGSYKELEPVCIGLLDRGLTAEIV